MAIPPRDIDLGGQPNPAPAEPKGCHPSHVLRGSDASSYDVVCVNCGYADISGGGWGKLSEPCPDAPAERPAGGGEAVAYVPAAALDMLKSKRMITSQLYRSVEDVDAPSAWIPLYARACAPAERPAGGDLVDIDLLESLRVKGNDCSFEGLTASNQFKLSLLEKWAALYAELKRARASSPDADRRWLNDLIRAAEAFRLAMIEQGQCVSRRSIDTLRALETALNPMNYREAQPFPDTERIRRLEEALAACQQERAWLDELVDGQSCSDLCDKTYEFQGCPSGTCAKREGTRKFRETTNLINRALQSTSAQQEGK